MFINQVPGFQTANLLVSCSEEADRRASAVDVGGNAALVQVAEAFVGADGVFDPP